MISPTINSASKRRLTVVAGIFLLLVVGNVRVDAKQPPSQRASLALSLVTITPGLWESQPIRTDVTVAGLSWSTVAPEAGWIRASADGEVWGSWETLIIAAEHGPDPLSPEDLGQRPASEPMFLGEVEWVQFRVETSVPGDIRAEVVETAGRQLGILSRIVLFLESVKWGSEPVGASPNQPEIVPREEWGGDQCNPNSGPPSYTDGVRMMFVHHTATYNAYLAEDVPGIIYAMCAYHVDTRGWRDIGYNFVIDRFGTIYEARDGGIENSVWGAQLLLVRCGPHGRFRCCRSHPGGD